MHNELPPNLVAEIHNLLFLKILCLGNSCTAQLGNYLMLCHAYWDPSCSCFYLRAWLWQGYPRKPMISQGLSSFCTSYSIVGRLNHEDAEAARPHKPSGQKSSRIILLSHSTNQSNSQDHLEFQEKKFVFTLMWQVVCFPGNGSFLAANCEDFYYYTIY